jgi:hypothetical protein
VLGCAAFLGACAIHYLGWRRFLGARLNDPDPERRRAGLAAWARFAISWQLLVIVLCVAWLIPVGLGRHAGYAWIAPPAGLVIGAALPLQLVVMSITRSAKRL